MKLCKWAVAFTTEGKLYDDGKPRTSVVALFRYPFQAEDFIEKCLPPENKQRFFVINTDALEDEEEADEMGRAKKFRLFMGCLGNGTTVCNAAVEEHGDYKKVAHIANDGKITWYVSEDYCPADALEAIKRCADRQKEEAKC